YPPALRFFRAATVGATSSAILVGAGGGGGGGLGVGMFALHTVGVLLLFLDCSLDELDDGPRSEPVPDMTIPVLKARDGDRETLLQGIHQSGVDHRHVVICLHHVP
ncbi:MAG: hypothetical protein ACK528_11530, partial [Alphaproteobacteria bacterium]